MTIPAVTETKPGTTTPTAPEKKRRRTELPAPGDNPTATQPADYVDRLVHRYGDERRALQVIGDDNFQLRERHRKDTEDLNAAND